MNIEYWDNNLVKIIYAFNTLMFLGLPVAIITQGKSEKIPLLVFIFMFCLGVIFARALINSFFFPAYKIDGNTLHIRRFFKSTANIEPNDSWNISGDNDNIFLSKGNESFMIQKFNLGKKQFKDLMQNLCVMSDKNSN